MAPLALRELMMVRSVEMGNTVAIGRAARIHREAAIGLEGIDEVAVAALQRLVLAISERAHDVEAVAVQVAEAAGAGEAVDVAAARLGLVHERLQVHAGEVLARDEVDHAAHRVRAVDRRGAVLQHLDALDGGERDLVQVDGAAVQAMRGDAPAVQQHEGRIRSLAAQVGRARAVVAARRARDHVGVAREVVEAVRVGGELHHQLLGRLDARALDVLARDDLDGQRALGLDALDVAARDLDALAGLRDLRERRRRHAQQRDRRR
jgi:hypothetical protein